MRALLLAMLAPLAAGFALAQPTAVNLFNGRDLTGWKQLNGTATFRAEDGMIVGTTTATTQNSFLVTEAVYDDFEFEAEFKMDSVNSGIQFRSEAKAEIQDGRVTGYQVDFDPTPRQWTGGVYEEGRRGWIYPLAYHPKGKTAFRAGAWNHCRIRCVKNHIQVWINQQPTASLIDDAAAAGFIGLQIHGVYRQEDVGKNVYWRKLRLRQATPAHRRSPIFTADLVAARNQPAFRVSEYPTQKKITVRWGESLLTEYIYPDSLFKPVLHPFQTLSGISVTRNYPLKKVAAERADHPHQAGIFFTHESVNKLDFWNLSTAIPVTERKRYGRIVHSRTVCAQGLTDRATLITTSLWQSYDGTQLLLEELTTHEFKKNKGVLHYDRTTELRALQPVLFDDVKDALLGIRVARELELKNEWADPFIETDLSMSPARIDNTRATGNFLNQQGRQGEAVWGRRSPWLALFGHIQSRDLSLVVFDHPENKSHPPYWHARGYGLMAVNPLGSAFFTEGKSHTQLQLSKGEQIRFRYRMLLAEKKLTTAQIAKRFRHYAQP